MVLLFKPVFPNSYNKNSTIFWKPHGGGEERKIICIATDNFA